MRCCLLGLCLLMMGGLLVMAQSPDSETRPTSRQLMEMAEKGDALSQFKLGVMHAVGRGVARDDEASVKWFRKAVGTGPDAGAARHRSTTRTRIRTQAGPYRSATRQLNCQTPGYSGWGCNNRGAETRRGRLLEGCWVGGETEERILTPPDSSGVATSVSPSPLRFQGDEDIGAPLLAPAGPVMVFQDARCVASTVLAGFGWSLA